MEVYKRQIMRMFLAIIVWMYIYQEQVFLVTAASKSPTSKKPGIRQVISTTKKPGTDQVSFANKIFDIIAPRTIKFFYFAEQCLFNRASYMQVPQHHSDYGM